VRTRWATPERRNAWHGHDLIRGLRGTEHASHASLHRVGIGLARLGLEQFGLGLGQRIGRLLARHGSHDVELVGQVGVPEHGRIRDLHARLAHFQRLRELRVLERDL
jgi:hypothetical protein